MKITEFSVKNHQFTIIVFVMIMLLGFSSLLNMPKAEDPDLKATYNSIVVVYPGTSPEDMEKLVLEPLEDKLSAISEIKKMVSYANDGVASVIIEFNHDVKEDEKHNEVLRELNSLRNKLPQDIYSMDVFKYTPETVNIMQGAFLSETASYADLSDRAKELKDKIKKLKDINEVMIHAAPERIVRVAVNTDRLAQFKIPLTRLISIIQSENINIPAGAIEIGDRKINVKTSGSYESLDEIKNTVISTSGTQITYLKDVADVDFGYEEETYLARLKGKRGIFITASQKKGTNIFEINNKLSLILEEFSKTLQKNIKFENIQNIFEDSQSNLWVATFGNGLIKMNYSQKGNFTKYDYFNKANGELLYLNNIGGHSGNDWWYDMMPNIYFYQLYDLYGPIGDAENQFDHVANKINEAASAIPGALPTLCKQSNFCNSGILYWIKSMAF